jgi:hypothetical protein
LYSGVLKRCPCQHKFTDRGLIFTTTIRPPLIL